MAEKPAEKPKTQAPASCEKLGKSLGGDGFIYRNNSYCIKKPTAYVVTMQSLRFHVSNTLFSLNALSLTPSAGPLKCLEISACHELTLSEDEKSQHRQSNVFLFPNYC